jgi:hypothetical protein
MQKRELEKKAVRELKRWVRRWRAKYCTAPDANSGFGDEIALFRAGERLIEHDNRGRKRAR